MEHNHIEPDVIATAVGARLRSAFGGLSLVRDRTERHLDSISRDRPPQREDLSSVGDLLQSVLNDHAGVIDGIGIASVNGYLQDSQFWIEWWRFKNSRELEFVAHSLNPSRDHFYDYADRDWFTRPLSSGGMSVTGPYVDFGGTNTSTVTLALPIVVGGAYVAVAGADIHASHFEDYLLSSATLADVDGALSGSALLINSDNRVIASNSADHLPGDLVSTNEFASWDSTAINVGPTADAGWHLFVRNTGIA
ncbi:cache domain-containing protein [Brevibacterium sp. FAM 25378]|uniref:cache domain-containing protein n=1 Tax=unclassified Brevibacterium TaxID=2614124 RepID=UPI001091F818|nr:cache domain-containing protein [Brevibacterium sp. S22]TGD31405.1 hypothetical protein EB835_08260 [Brevibacterium sp. S22]